MTRADAGTASGARNGVYSAPQDYARVQVPGALRCVVDLAGARGKQGLLAAFAQALRFPPDFGWNWDALADGLQDLSWLTTSGVVVDIRAADALDPAAAGDWAIALDILEDAATYWRKHERLFLVFVQGVSSLPELAP